MQQADAAAKRIFNFLDIPNEISDKNLPAIKKAIGKVQMENVAFSYTPAKPLITDLNVNVFSGQKIAIVGPTGAGKTTMVNLLMKFYDINDISFLGLGGNDE